MPHFTYSALTPAGELREGRMEARDARAVLRHLETQGLLPVEAKPVIASGSRFRLSPGAGAEARDLAVAMREMVLLIGAGQTVEQALRLLATEAGPPRLRPRLEQVLERLRGGGSLAEAMTAAGGFPPLALAMVKAGEAGGTLDVTLANLADLLERALKLREQIQSALMYPMVLLIAAVGSLLLLLTQVVPQFAPMLKQGGKALPASTSLVLAASDALLAHGTALMIVALVSVVAAPLILRRLPPGWWEGAVLKTPGIGELVAMAATARLCRTLGTLLKGGVPLPTALGLASEVAGLRSLSRAALAMRAGAAEGRGLAASLPPDSPMPPLAIQLLKVGEESGRIEEILNHLAGLFDAKVELTLKRVLAVFEPACILLLAVLVGGIVVSILSAVMSINELAF